ncbi:cation diffusion facilitator CzcD-associated flavoprotein CzcO [Microbacterium ginsengiterrae]|uniref:Cation diffusion facilitator CzcD-associated flavoprotein CzcO n=1 Tax=Microbacterium ginsengiterrae TaxID=546115 RepID=A0A7W9CBK8_9MICO|nr:NAD(P)/FAD-dependent oxidoreductase [Microbacterium ginsengiterrae]MBB5742583.1 cation diffusion facilitator CzcD-associated flavoprotein CzcO [Microbacterium ginsengiterrae]
MSDIKQYDAVVVGAGFSGLYALHRLRSLGLSVQTYERGSGLGGTWFWNRYPGLQCDTEAMAYTFTFDPALYRRWNWSKRFAPWHEILDYANFVADELDLRRDIQFDTTVVSAQFDEDRALWHIGLEGGEQVDARYFVPAPGPLNAANIPPMPGLENFSGEWYHTGEWPIEQPDFAGKRVAVIGTGSSGAQLICALNSVVSELTVFQRTAQYITPARQRPLDESARAAWKDNIERLHEEMRQSAFGAPGTSTARSAHEDTPEQRDAVFQAAWDHGAQAFALATYNDLNTDEEANSWAADFVRRKIASIVTDPETARKLMPSYHFGTKRPVKADGYYEAFNRDNVHLVALGEEPIVEITENGIRTSEQEYEFDVILFATGFDAVTGQLFKIDIRGRDGQTLKDKWRNGVEVRTNLGVTTSGFPNMFLLQGPQAPSIMASYLFGIQINVDFVASIIEEAEKRGAGLVESTRAAELAWSDFCQALAERTFVLKTESFWTGANIASKPRPEIITIYMGGIKVYADRLEDIIAHDFKGFRFIPEHEGEAETITDAELEAWVRDKVDELVATTQG